MEETIRDVGPDDWSDISGIFNHFVAESFAAYSEIPVGKHFFQDRWMTQPDYPFLVAESAGKAIGFAYLAPFHPAQTMKHSATLTYFILPEHTGKGIGQKFLEILIQKGQQKGITNFLANISSKNPGSLRFHLRNGFHECGRMEQVGVKHGQAFDMIWVQKRFP